MVVLLMVLDDDDDGPYLRVEEVDDRLLDQLARPLTVHR
jgi:hypothetical protein